MITWEQTKRIISQKYRKHKLYNTMLTRLVRQCCKKKQSRCLSLHICLFRIPIFFCLLLFCLHFFLIKREHISCISKDQRHHMKTLKKMVCSGVVTTHLLPVLLVLFSCALHRLCISLHSRGRLLCSPCKDSVSLQKINSASTVTHSKKFSWGREKKRTFFNSRPFAR